MKIWKICEIEECLEIIEISRFLMLTWLWTFNQNCCLSTQYPYDPNFCLGHPVYNIYLHRLSSNFIIKALLKNFIYFLHVPKTSKIRHLRKKLNIHRRRHFIRKLSFLVPVFPLDLGDYPRLDLSKALLQRYH